MHQRTGVQFGDARMSQVVQESVGEQMFASVLETLVTPVAQILEHITGVGEVILQEQGGGDLASTSREDDDAPL